MAPKKKKITSKHRLPSPSAATAISDELMSNLRKALQLAKDGEFTEANSLVNDIRFHHESSAFFHRVNATIQFNQTVKDAATIQEAIASARKATILSPSNLEYSLFYASVLVILTQNCKVASKECERALSVTNPISPTAAESFGSLAYEDDVSHITTEVGRIKYYQQELRDFLMSARKHDSDNVVQIGKKQLINSEKQIQEDPRKGRVQSYLESITSAEVREWIELDTKGILRNSIFYKGAYHVLSEALAFAEGNQTWEFWVCPFCCQKLGDSRSHVTHVMNMHVHGIDWGELRKQLPQQINQEWAEKLADGNWMPIDVDAALKLFQQMAEWELWPLSDDAKRMDLLQRIRNLFQILVRCRYLTMGHLNFVLNYAMEQIRAQPTTSLLVNHGVNQQSTLCIRILDDFHLTKILAFLESISEACELGGQSNNQCLDDDHDAILDASASEISERIILDRRTSRLVLDPRSFCKQEGHSKDNNLCFEERFNCALDVEALVSCMYKGNSWNESYLAWNDSLTSKIIQTNEIIEKLLMEYYLLCNLCTRKCSLLVSARALKQSENLCRDKLNKRENEVDSGLPSYEAILRKEKEETEKKVDAGSEAMAMIKTISDVLKMAKKVKQLDISDDKSPEFNSDDDDSSVSSSLNDLEDACIEKALHVLDEKGSLERNKVDANIMTKLHSTQQLKLKLRTSTSLNFLTILTPLVKSFLQKILEEAAENVAINKSETACESLLAVERNDRNTDKRRNHPKQIQGKSKGGKKSNPSKKFMGIKAASSNEKHLQQETEVHAVKGNPKESQVQSYLESLTPVEKQAWIEIGVRELKEYCTFSPHAYDVLMEALPFAEVNYTWNFWTCPVCYEKCADSDSHLQHVMNEHVGPVLSDEMKKQLPQPLNRDWASKLVSGSWEPIGVEPLEKMLGCAANADDLVSNDAVRTKLLHRIGATFRMLVKYNYVAVGHLEFVLDHAMEQVRAHPSASLLMKQGVNEQSTLCIRMLDDFHLTKILVFLQNLIEACELGIHSKRESFHDDHNAIPDATDGEVVGRILVDRSSIKLILDPQAFCKRSDHDKDDSSCVDDGLKCVFDVEAVVSWLYRGLSWNDSYLAWNECRIAKANRSKEIFQMLQQEYHIMRDLCTKKQECLVYAGALKHVEDLCRDRLKSSENDVETNFPSCEAILRTERGKCVKECHAGSDVAVVVRTISEVLKIAQKVKKLDMSDDASLEFNSDDANGDDDDTRISSSSKYLEDTFVEKAFQIVNEKGTLEQSKIDALIMKKLHRTRQLELMLGTASLSDFLPVVTPLVKSFLQKIIEEEAENVAINKPGTACDAPLAEEHDVWNTDNGGDHHDGSTSNPEQIASDYHLKEQEEEYRLRLEEDDRKVEEYLEFQRRVENESKQKALARQKNVTTTPPDNSDVVAD